MNDFSLNEEYSCISIHFFADFNHTKVRLIGLTTKEKRLFSVSHCCISGLLVPITNTLFSLSLRFLSRIYKPLI